MTYLVNPHRFGGGATLEGFIIHMETTGASETVTLPLTHTGVTVDWGDGSGDDVIASGGAVAHEYATADTYRIVITGSATTIAFNNGGDKLKARRVENWGDLGWVNMSGAFRGCTGLTTVDATDGANLAAVTNMGSMFRDCSSLTSLDVSGFSTAAVTSMYAMFYNCSSLTSLDVSGFSTAAVTNMYSMFYNCSSLTSLDVSGFSTAAVTNMYAMFRECSSLTSDPGIVSFDISALTSATNMCLSANAMLSTAEYDAILVAWEAQTELANVPVHFGDATYTSGSAAATARAALVANGWTVTDGGSV